MELLVFKRIFAAIFVAVILSNQFVTVVKAAPSFDEPFYSSNDILFYDPRCDTGQATGEILSLSGKDNIEKVLKFLMAPSQGLTLAQASGVVGNLMAESGQTINPAIIQGGGNATKDYVPVNGVGFGIAQWTFTARQQPLMQYMKPYNDITNLDGQVGFLWSELTGTHAEALRQIRTTVTPLDAAVAFHKYYEGSADSADQVAGNRGGNAQKVYNTYADAPALAGSTAEGTSQTDTTQPVSGSQSCTATAAGGDLISLVKSYAWPEYKGLTTTPTDAYHDAVQAAIAQGRYVGGVAYPGIDCGGFVTTLMIDSKFETGYNSNGKGGYTVIQEQWLKQNWKPISATDATDRQPGDVAINETHTYVFVGPDAFPNHKPIASASLDERAPMQGNESVVDSSFRWYRKPGVTPATSGSISTTAGGGGGSW